MNLLKSDLPSKFYNFFLPSNGIIIGDAIKR